MIHLKTGGIYDELHHYHGSSYFRVFGHWAEYRVR